jgi:thiamine pyrophosphate-dependent acetolactate synthase large subunit-like protein
MTRLAAAAAMLQKAQKPVILLGTRARAALPAIEALGGRLAAALLTTPEAKSLLDETRPENAGVFSFGASAYACALVEAADTVLALGTELGEFASRGGRAFAGKRVIQVVDDARHIATTLTPDLVIVDALSYVAAALTAQLAPRASGGRWFEALREESRRVPSERPAPPAPAGTIEPAAAIAAIVAALPNHARIACDVTSATLSLMRDARLGPERRLWCNLEKSACMGGALAAGIGLRIGSGLPTAVLIGDWGLTMGSSELHTLASLGLSKFAVVVWSNAGGALIRCGVRAQGIDVGSDLHTWQQPPRFVQVARGYGLRALRVRSAATLTRALRRALGESGPTLLEAMIDPNAAVPAGDRYLHLDASTKSA